jgi:predicted transcriptional regulator
MKNRRQPIQRDAVERLSISLPKEDKEALERIADTKRVSLAWVIRDAVTQYLGSNDTAKPGK